MAITNWAAHMTEAMQEVLARALALLPNLLGCVALLALGWLLATVARAVCTRLGDRGLALLARRQVLHARLAQFAAIRTAPHPSPDNSRRTSEASAGIEKPSSIGQGKQASRSASQASSGCPPTREP